MKKEKLILAVKFVGLCAGIAAIALTFVALLWACAATGVPM